MNTMMSFAGIGSRDTPSDVYPVILDLCEVLVANNYTLRSGGAQGADTMFETAYNELSGSKEIYLPWSSFAKTRTNLTNHLYFDTPTKEALQLASEIHPYWNGLSHGAKLLHARNSHQILGYELNNPVKFVLCWRIKSGGTDQAIRIANKYNIKVINLAETKLTKAELVNYLTSV